MHKPAVYGILWRVILFAVHKQSKVHKGMDVTSSSTLQYSLYTFMDDMKNYNFANYVQAFNCGLCADQKSLDHNKIRLLLYFPISQSSV